MNRRVLMAVAGLLLGAVSAWAHHAFASEFDAKKPVHLAGVITKLELVNPHAWIYLDVKDANGQVNAWAVEAGASPNIMMRRGFTKSSLPIGSEVIVDGYRSKDGTFKASGTNLTYADGRMVFIGASGAEGPNNEGKK